MKKPSSALGSFLRFFGSIKLAMLLLIVIIVATTVGTLLESRLDASVARTYVYDSPWFIAWLVLLCVNLIGAVVVRYPWKPHQIGFIITHGGMVVILAGGIIGRIWGVEGNVVLVSGEKPQDFLVVNDPLLQVQRPGQGTETFPLRLDLRHPTEERPFHYRAGDLRVSVMEVADELGVRPVIRPAGERGSPALRLVITADEAPRPFDHWLMKDHGQKGTLTIGPDIIRFATETPEMQTPSREVHFAFSNAPGMNLSRLVSGDPSQAVSNYRFNSSNNSSSEHGHLEIQLEGRRFVFPVKNAIGQPKPLEGTGWTLRILDYLPDFRMEGNVPVSASREPNNPAVIFELSGSSGHRHERPLVSAHHGHAKSYSPIHSIHTASFDGLNATNRGRTGNELNILYNGQGKLVYESWTKDGTVTGTIALDEDFSAGWNGWKFRVEEFLERAVLREEVGPMTESGMRRIGASGLRVKLEIDGESTERWLQMGSMAFVPLAGEALHAGFGFRKHPLDFAVELERFEVEFDPGTQTPASFKSHLVFTLNNGKKTRRAVWMNHPTNFPDFTGAGLLGTSYKFSQASWDPGNHDQTTLQVIRDPGWSLKWIGSLLFFVGLVTVFYLKPYPRLIRTPAGTRKPVVTSRKHLS